MTVIRCPPSEHEFTIKYQGKTYYGDYKRIRNVAKQIGISSPIMHYPYVCEEEGCNIRFMFHADITEHYILHHNIPNPKIDFKKLIFFSHRYTPEARKNDGFFTLDELMNFNENDFKKYNVLFNKKKSPPCSDSAFSIKKKKSAPNIEKIENLLHDFASTDDVEYEPEESNVLSSFENKSLSNSKTELHDNDTTLKDDKINNEETMVIDLTKAPDDLDSDDGIEILATYVGNKNETKFHKIFHSQLNSSNRIRKSLDVSNNSTKDLDSNLPDVTLNKSTKDKELLLSPISDKQTQEKPLKLTPTKVTRASPILQVRNTIVEKSKSPKISVCNVVNENEKINSPQFYKYNTQNVAYPQQNLKSKDQTSKDQKDVMQKVTQILHENAPKKVTETTRNCSADGIGNTTNFSTIKEHSVEQSNEVSCFPHKITCYEQSSSEQITNVPSSTNNTPMIKLNGTSKRMDKIYYCIFSEDCNFFTKYRINYEKHMSDHAIIKFLFRCNSCPLVFQTENVFIEHKTKYCVKSVGPVRPLQQPSIPRRQEFVNLANYYDLIMCRYSDICSFVCNTNEELRYHIQELHDNNQTLYTCMKCSALFKDKVSLAIHSRNYCWKTMELQISEGKLMHCNAENCDFSSYSVPEWHIHLASHLYIGEKTPYECSKCYIFLATKTAEVEHERYFCHIIKPKLVDLSNKHYYNMKV